MNIMEEKKTSVAANALNYGLITGAVIIVYNLLLYIANLYMNQALGWVAYLFLVGGMVWGTLEYRKKLEGGFLTYGQAFSSCFFIGMIAGILAIIYMFFYVKYINPGIVNEIMEQSRQKLQEKNLTEDQIEAGLEWTRKFTTPGIMTVFGLIAYAFFSALLGLIASIFLKKVDPNAPTSAL